MKHGFIWTLSIGATGGPSKTTMIGTSPSKIDLKILYTGLQNHALAKSGATSHSRRNTATVRSMATTRTSSPSDLMTRLSQQGRRMPGMSCSFRDVFSFRFFFHVSSHITMHRAQMSHVQKKKESDETKQSAGKKKRLICYRCGGKGHPARLCPSGNDCQDVDEVGTDSSSDADSDLFGLDWGDDPIATINSVTERNDRTRGGKELLAFVDSSAVDNVLPKSVCTEYPLEATSKSQSGVGIKGANGSHIKALWAAMFSSQDKRWKHYDHHVGGRRCAQTADVRQPSP